MFEGASAAGLDLEPLVAICATLALASPAGGGCAAGPVRSWLAQGLLGPSKGCRRGLKNCKHSSLIEFNLVRGRVSFVCLKLAML